MSDTVEELIDSLERALRVMKSRGEVRFGVDVENLLRIRRVLEGLDPDEVDALLEVDDDEE